MGLCDSDSRPRSAIGRMVRVLGAPPSCVIGAQLRSWAAFGCDRAGEIYKMRTFRVAVLGLALAAVRFSVRKLLKTPVCKWSGCRKNRCLVAWVPQRPRLPKANPIWGFNSGNGMTVVDASYGRYGCSAVASSTSVISTSCSRVDRSPRSITPDLRVGF